MIGQNCQVKTYFVLLLSPFLSAVQHISSNTILDENMKLLGLLLLLLLNCCCVAAINHKKRLCRIELSHYYKSLFIPFTPSRYIIKKDIADNEIWGKTGTL